MKEKDIANLAMIVAMAENRVIGSQGKIPWDLPEDREHFKCLTMGQVIIMGRRSYEEIGKPLPGRITYVVTSTMTAEENGCQIASSLREAIEHAEKNYPHKKIFLCGGTRIYEEGMAFAEEIYVTMIEQQIKGDTYFPEIPEEFHIVEKEKRETVTFVTYRK